MTITAETPATSYAGDGATTVFAIGFTLAVDQDLVVRVDGVIVGLAAQYNIVGGNVEFLSAPADEATIEFFRWTPLTQQRSFPTKNSVNPVAIEGASDKLTLISQEHRAALGRTIQGRIGDEGLLLPPLAERKGKHLGFNAATGQLEVNDARGPKGDPGANVLAVGLFADLGSISVPLGSDLVQTAGYAQKGRGAARYAATSNTGATRYRVQTANGRWFELAEQEPTASMFGAVADATASVPTDNAAAVNAGLAYLAPSGGPSQNGYARELRLGDEPAGYAFAQDIIVPTNVQLGSCGWMSYMRAMSGAKISIGGTSSSQHYFSGLNGVKVVGDVDGSGNPLSDNLIVCDYVTRGLLRAHADYSKYQTIWVKNNARNMRLENLYATHGCQAAASMMGAVHVEGSDHTPVGFIIGQATITTAEIAAEQAAPGSTKIPYKVGVYWRATHCRNVNIRGEISGVPVYIFTAFSNTFGEVLADTAALHGIWVKNAADFSGTFRISGCSLLQAGAYDAVFFEDGTVARYNVPVIAYDTNVAPGFAAQAPRYLFNQAGSPALIDTGVIGYPTGRISAPTVRLKLPQNGPQVVMGHHPFRAFTAGDATPSVDLGCRFKFANVSDTNVTTFDDGFEGQEITVIGDGKSILVNGSGIFTINGRNYRIPSGDMVRLIKEPTTGNWRMVSPLRGLTGTTTTDLGSLASGAQTSRTITVSASTPNAEPGDQVEVTADIDLQGLLMTAYVSGVSTVTVLFANLTAGAVDLPAMNLRAFVTRIGLV